MTSDTGRQSPPSTAAPPLPDASTVACQRHLLREQLLDESTRWRLQKLGVTGGWQCLEVGAGHGSSARWLADEVGDKLKAALDTL